MSGSDVVIVSAAAFLGTMAGHGSWPFTAHLRQHIELRLWAKHQPKVSTAFCGTCQKPFDGRLP